MTAEQFDLVESKLVKVIEFWSERATTAAEAESLAAVVEALANLVAVRRSTLGGLREFE